MGNLRLGSICLFFTLLNMVQRGVGGRVQRFKEVGFKRQELKDAFKSNLVLPYHFLLSILAIYFEGAHNTSLNIMFQHYNHLNKVA